MRYLGRVKRFCRFELCFGVGFGAFRFTRKLERSKRLRGIRERVRFQQERVRFQQERSRFQQERGDVGLDGEDAVEERHLD